MEILLIFFSKIYKILFFSRYLIFILIFIFSSIISKTEAYLRYQKFIRVHDSQIKMTIIGRGTKNILSNSYSINPFDVLVNEVSKKDSCSKTCRFDDELNNITLVFNQEVNTCANMFNDLTLRSGLLWGKVVIDTVKEKVILSNIDKAALAEIEQNVSSVMMEEKKKYGRERGKEE